MKVTVDGVDLLELSKTHKMIIANDIHADELEGDLKRRLHWVLSHKIEQCYERLKKEWEPKLAARGLESIPTNPEKFAELVFGQPDYADRKTRDSK